MSLASLRAPSIHPLFLSFDDQELEGDYLVERAAAATWPLQILFGTLALMGAVGGLVAMVDGVIAPLSAESTAVMQHRLLYVDFGYVLSVSTALLALSRTPLFGRAQQQLMTAYLLGFPLVAIWPLAAAPVDIGVHAFPLMILHVFDIHLVGRLRFVYATASALFVSALYLAVCFWLLAFPLNALPFQAFVLGVVNVLGMLGSYSLERYARQNFVAARQLADEQARSESLLLNILPRTIAERLKTGEGTIADRIDEVTLLFADIVGFTPWSRTRSPEQVVALLDALFSGFDAQAEAAGVEKIKTIGDAYLAVAGLPETRPDHAVAVIELALAMQQAAAEIGAAHDAVLSLRIGVHTGPIVAGVIGRRRLAYDLWGDTVNVAARMEQHGVPGAIQISGATRQRLGVRYALRSRGSIDIKGIGPMETFLLEG